MTQPEAKNHASADETRKFIDKGQVEIVNIAGGTVGRGTFEPGWRWSEHVKPIAKTDSCQATHMGHVLSGRMKVVMDDGTELEVVQGDSFLMPSGHDAWTVGDEACVLIDFAGMENYAK